MTLEMPSDKHQQIIQNRVLPKIQEIFPKEAECEMDTHFESDCVIVEYKTRLPDDLNKPPEIKHERIIIWFSSDLIDDFLDPENASTKKHFETVLDRIFNYIKKEYSEIDNQNVKNRECHKIMVTQKSLNLVFSC